MLDYNLSGNCLDLKRHLLSGKESPALDAA